MCRYSLRAAKHRGSLGGARRDLETFHAAINRHAKEGFRRGLVRVSLPRKGEARDRWLTRDEAPALIWHCWRYRENQTIHSGTSKRRSVKTERRPLRHIARFILIGLYTGTRAGAIASASPYAEPGRSYADLDRGIFYRKPIGKRATKKRQTPAPIPPRLLAHMRRWTARKLIATCFVEFNSKPISSVKKGFHSAVRLAGLTGRVTPHTLRHTAATWLDLGGGRFLGRVARGPARHPPASSPRSFTGRGGCNRTKKQVRFGG
jgi:integrase